MTGLIQSRQFREWVLKLEEEVIQGEFGFDPGEFSVHTEHWYPLFRESLTPCEAWQRALNAAAAADQERERKKEENWKRIQAEDAATIARASTAGHE